MNAYSRTAMQQTCFLQWMRRIGELFLARAHDLSAHAAMLNVQLQWVSLLSANLSSSFPSFAVSSRGASSCHISIHNHEDISHFIFTGLQLPDH